MTKESENKDSREQGGAMVPLLTAARMLAEGNHEGALERARSVTGGAYHAKALMLEAQVLALKGAPDEQTEAVLKKAADAGDKTAAFYKAYTDAGSTDTEVVQAAEGFQNWAVVRHVALFRSAESLQPPTPEERAEQRRAVEEHIARLEASEAEAEKARREAEAKAAAERARREAEAKAAAEQARREAEAKAAAERARREAEAEKARKEAEAKAAAEAARKKAKAEADAKAAAEKARKEAARKASSRKGVPVLLALLVAGVEAVLFCRIWGVEASSWFNRSLAILLFALSLLVFPVAHALMEGATNREKAVSASADGQLALAVNCVAMLLAHLQTFHIIFAGEPLNTLCILGCFGLLYLALIVVCFTLCLADGADDNGSHGRCVGALFWTPIAACLLYFGILRLFGTPWDAFVQVISQLTA